MNGLALCAGTGGMELGLRLALGRDYRSICYVERDSYAASCLVARMEDKALDQAPVWDDITTFDGWPWDGKVDIVSAGFPCQPFSAAGKRLGVADARWLWPAIARIVAEVRPSLVFLENSPRVRSVLGHILWDLAGMGFDAEWGVYSAAEQGAPHIRRRCFLLAHSRRNPLRDEPGRGIREDGQGQAELGEAGPGTYPPGLGLAEQGVLEGHRKGDDEYVGLCKDVPDSDARGRDGRTRNIPETPRREELADGGWWASESGLDRVANGTPARMDRLRCIGNGVVPKVVAYAFTDLWGRLCGSGLKSDSL